MTPAGRIAIVMPVHDEDPASVFRSLRATVASLDATGRSRAFDIFLLSDTQDERLASAERTLFAAWKRSDRRPGRLHYRRRLEKSGFKAGNLRDFCNRWGRTYDFMVVLDADSALSGAAILRLVGLMQANLEARHSADAGRRAALDERVHPHVSVHASRHARVHHGQRLVAG